MLVKSLREKDHLDDLRETFNTLRSFNMKLNPSKCAFGVTAGKFLGFMVSQRGIEVNSEKVRAIMELEPLRMVKEVQSLNGKIAALNRFVSRATDRCLPFFRTLRKSFEWTNECQAAFNDLKAYLLSPPLLSPSVQGEELYLYLAVSYAAVSAALVREEEGIQKLVYFTSRALRGAEERYPQMEKWAFALVIVARRLKPYFQAHTIIVLTDKPLRKAMNSPEAARRMALWAIELSEFDIQYRPRTAMKGQAVADFIAEFTLREDQLEEVKEQWKIYTDGSSNRRAGGAGVVIQTPRGDTIRCMIRLDFPITNNEVEYEALVAGLDLAKAARAENVIVHCDSQVVTSQINGDYECKNDRMKKYLEEVKYRINSIEVEFVQIPREENGWADQLAKSASTEFVVVPEQVEDFECDWTTPLIAYLKAGVLPDEKGAARKWKVQASRFVLIKDILYKREAVIPAEVGLTSYRVESYDEDVNKEAMRLQLDLLDEVRTTAEQRLARYQNLMVRHYNSKVRHRDFRVGDLVLRKVMGAARDSSQGKLGPNWEGPYRITSWQRKGTYHLETLDGGKLQHPWNSEHLRKYYP
ncbi:uncharacterized protein LOC126728762 [Quercus robur]|uniref:uncharacterized protein LOC126728762 n=1 Tax=Quercus robur TaxID=38942 RepID=UPI002163E877|nr:uncharacterized protein LOC126728762 [Quercus robur]